MTMRAETPREYQQSVIEVSEDSINSIEKVEEWKVLANGNRTMNNEASPRENGKTLKSFFSFSIEMMHKISGNAPQNVGTFLYQGLQVSLTNLVKKINPLFNKFFFLFFKERVQQMRSQLSTVMKIIKSGPARPQNPPRVFMTTVQL